MSKQDKDIIENIQQQIRKQSDHVEPDTARELTNIRRQALRLAEDKASFNLFQPWIMATSVAASILIISLITLNMNSQPDLNIMEDLTLLSTSESLNFYEELEFYQWLEESEQHG